MHWALIVICLWNKDITKIFHFWLYKYIDIYCSEHILIYKEKQTQKVFLVGEKISTPDEENTQEKYLNINKWTITEG